MTDLLNPDASAAKRKCRRFYNNISESLNVSEYSRHATFLNYGFVSDGAPELSPITLPTRCLNKNSVKLVLELVGDVTIDGKAVLDVGCGRGGAIDTFARYFSPRVLVGLDLSEAAVTFCKSRAHGRARPLFLQGDAEQIPFRAESFDVVTNLESSQHYPNIRSFYEGVYRVLRPDGVFAYGDVMSSDARRKAIEDCSSVGFECVMRRDITNNVMLSCADVSAVRMDAYSGVTDQGELATFLAVPGSPFYQKLARREWTFESWILKKSSR